MRIKLASSMYMLWPMCHLSTLLVIKPGYLAMSPGFDQKSETLKFDAGPERGPHKL
ncbi:hypothetical protein D3C87_2001930 [compost metagenome]